MKWRKRGLVFCPNGEHPWMVSHASNPVAEPRGGNELRVYFSCRDKDNRAHIAFLDIAVNGDKIDVVRVADEPVLAPGPRGTFDDSGTSMACLVCNGDRTLLYYLGWNLGVTVPWRNSIGLAVRTGADGAFTRVSPAPIVDRSAEDPFTLSYPCVLKNGDTWRMWYGSNLSWGETERDMNHVIKYAESDDGIHWRRDGAVALGFHAPDEFAICRPWVVPERRGYRMWFCHRGAAYRIGTAESMDGITWRHSADPPFPDVSITGWDSEMVCYPSLCEHQGRRYLFYNGNRYGLTGFGVAVEDE